MSSFVLSYLSWHLCLSLLSFYLLSVVFILILMKLSCHFILTVVFILIPSLFIPLPYSYPSSLSTSSILSSWFLRYLPQHFCLSVNLAAALSVVFTLGPIDVSVFLSSLLLAPLTFPSFCRLYSWPNWRFRLSVVFTHGPMDSSVLLSSLLLAPIDVAVFLSSLPLLCTRFSLWPLKIQYGIFHECTSIGCICLMGREGCTHNTHIIHTHNGMTLTQLIDFRVGGEGLKIGPLSGPTRLNYRHKAGIQGFWIPPSN